MIRFYIFLFFLLIFFKLPAQLSFFEGERPSFSMSPHTMGKNKFQAEFGYLRSVEWQNGKKDRVYYNAPQLLTRYGIKDSWEARLGANLSLDKTFAANGVSLSDIFTTLSIGTKFKLAKQRHIIPTISLLTTAVYKPSLHKYTNNVDTLFDYQLKFLFENIVNEHFLMRYAAGFERVDLLNPNPKFTFSLTPTYTFTDNWRLYVEYHSYKRNNNDERMAHYLASGLQYVTNSGIKFDLSTGYNLGRKKPEKNFDDFYYGAGVSFQFN